MGSEAPWISIMLRHRDQLYLTGEQVATLEQMRSGFEQIGRASCRERV